MEFGQPVDAAQPDDMPTGKADALATLYRELRGGLVGLTIRQAVPAFGIPMRQRSTTDHLFHR